MRSGIKMQLRFVKSPTKPVAKKINWFQNSGPFRFHGKFVLPKDMQPRLNLRATQ
jgi:hypothetical protein